MDELISTLYDGDQKHSIIYVQINDYYTEYSRWKIFCICGESGTVILIHNIRDDGQVLRNSIRFKSS